MLPIAGTRRYTVYQMDVVMAFLGSKLDEESYVHLRLAVLGCPRIAQLNHSLHGHKQSPRCWSSGKHILPHVLHRYFPVSSGNTIPPYLPCAFYISFLLLKLRWPSEGSKHTPGVIYLMLFSKSLSSLQWGRCVATPTPVLLWFLPFGHIGRCAAHLLVYIQKNRPLSGVLVQYSTFYSTCFPHYGLHPPSVACIRA